jgi:Flp pilus assembly protein TadB
VTYFADGDYFPSEWEREPQPGREVRNARRVLAGLAGAFVLVAVVLCGTVRPFAAAAFFALAAVTLIVREGIR